MSLRLGWSFPCLGLLVVVCLATDSGIRAADQGAPAVPSIPITTLRPLSTVDLSLGGYLAWSGPALCDEDANVYMLILAQDAKSPSIAPANLTGPRDVLRISADGKKRTTFNPAANAKFAGAEQVATLAMALDRAGSLHTLISTHWVDKFSKAETSRQYIVTFDQKGEYRSHVEVNWEDILVQQFDVFASGQFLLRGTVAHTGDARIAVLSAAGQTLEDVRGWGGDSKKPEEDDASEPPKEAFDYMVRGRDGRIYVTRQDAQRQKAVYAFGPSGEGEEVFKLRPLPGDPQLVGLKAAGDRFAAIYREAAPTGTSSTGKQKSRWLIAVYGGAGDGVEMQNVFGLAPGPPLCYQYTSPEDRFTFVSAGSKLVTMSSH